MPTSSVWTGVRRSTRPRADRPGRAVQGNLDPALLFAPLAGHRAEVRRILAEGEAAPGHVFNLGHGVPPEADPTVLHPGRRAGPRGQRATEARRRRRVAASGGIAGLAAALRLRDRLPPAPDHGLEAVRRRSAARSAPASRRRPVETGAETFLMRDPAGADSAAPSLARRLGLGDALVHPTRGGPRIASTVRCAPCRRHAAGRTGRSGASGRVARRRPTPTATPAGRCWPPGEDVAVGALVRARFGDEVVDRLVDPLLGGVYAGRADQLSLAATMPGAARAAADASTRCSGAVRRRARRRAHGRPARRSSPPSAVGCRRLVDAVARPAGVDGPRSALPVRELTRTGDGWRLTVGLDPRPAELDADAVVLAVPARPAAPAAGRARPAAAPAVAGSTTPAWPWSPWPAGRRRRCRSCPASWCRPTEG